MTTIDEYLNQIEAALEHYPDAEDAGELVERTVSVFSGDLPNISKGLDRYKARATAFGSSAEYDDEGDLRKLKGKLLLKKEADAAKELDDPFRLAIRKVDEDIDDCDRVLASGDVDKADKLVESMVRVYERDIDDIGFGLPVFDLGDANKTALDDLEIVRKHLDRYKGRLAVRMGEAKNGGVSISATAQNTNSNTLSINMKQVLQQIQEIPDSEFTDEQKSQLKVLLADLEAQRGESKKNSRGILKKVLSWLSDKGVDVTIAVLPYLVAWTQSLH